MGEGRGVGCSIELGQNQKNNNSKSTSVVLAFKRFGVLTGHFKRGKALRRTWSNVWTSSLYIVVHCRLSAQTTQEGRGEDLQPHECNHMVGRA